MVAAMVLVDAVLLLLLVDIMAAVVLVVSSFSGKSAILDHLRVTSTQSRPHDAKQTKHANHRDRLCQGFARQML